MKFMASSVTRDEEYSIEDLQSGSACVLNTFASVNNNFVARVTGTLVNNSYTVLGTDEPLTHKVIVAQKSIVPTLEAKDRYKLATDLIAYGAIKMSEDLQKDKIDDFHLAVNYMVENDIIKESDLFYWCDTLIVGGGKKSSFQVIVQDEWRVRMMAYTGRMFGSNSFAHGLSLSATTFGAESDKAVTNNNLPLLENTNESALLCSEPIRYENGLWQIEQGNYKSIGMNLRTSYVTKFINTNGHMKNVPYLLWRCSELRTCKISHLQTITNANWMFFGCNVLEVKFDIKKLSGLQTAIGMFQRAGIESTQAPISMTGETRIPATRVEGMFQKSGIYDSFENLVFEWAESIKALFNGSTTLKSIMVSA